VRADELKLDGNAIGGMLLELFGAEMTLAVTTCRSCGARGEIARLDVYVRCPGVVARCPACGAAQIRLVEGRGRMWIDLGGVRSLEIDRPA
jgi:Zn finger protein HypA/HybF involved in hydrogenase expression